jgi:hypothetical protein
LSFCSQLFWYDTQQLRIGSVHQRALRARPTFLLLLLLLLLLLCHQVTLVVATAVGLLYSSML